MGVNLEITPTKLCTEFLKVTAMRLNNVPPPMAQHEITLERNAVDVDVSNSTRDENPKSVMIAVLHHDGYSLYRWSLDFKAQQPPSVLSTRNFPGVSGTMNLQITCSTSGNIIYLSQDRESRVIWVLNNCDFGRSSIPQFDKQIGGFVRPGPNSGSTIYVIPDRIEAARTQEADLDKLYMSDDLRIALFQSSKSGVDATSWRSEASIPTSDLTNGGGTPPTKDIIFSLSENGSLFADERRLVRNCTSFLVTPAHLIFTTSQHLLKFVHLANIDGENRDAILRHPADAATQLLIYHQIRLNQTRDAAVLNAELAL